MRVFVLGGTGLIGSSRAQELVGRGHQLSGLARSGAAAAKLDQFGVTPIIGDIGTPEAWVGALPPCDAAIHMACDFNTDTGASYMAAAVESFPVGRIALAFARRFGAVNEAPRIISPDAIAAELGEWARGYALDQQLSGAKARRKLDWAPRHLEPEAGIAGHGSN